MTAVEKTKIFVNNAPEDEGLLLEPLFNLHVSNPDIVVQDVTIEDCDYVLSFVSNNFVKQSSEAMSKLSYAACSLRKPFILVLLENLQEMPSALEMMSSANGFISIENLNEGFTERINTPLHEWAELNLENKYAYKPFEASEESYAFVSYAHDDNHLVYPIIKDLYENGWNLWYDEGIRISERYITSIANHVKDCKVFLLFVTQTSINRPFVVDFELAYAKKLNKPIVPIHTAPFISALPELISEKEVIEPSGIDEFLSRSLMVNKGEREAIPPKDKKGEEYDIAGLSPLPGFEYEIVSDSIKLTGYTGLEKNVEIPREHCDLPIITIGERCFSSCSSVTNISMHDNITDIDEYAFGYCPALTDIVFSDNVKELKIGVLVDCIALKNVKLPKDLVTIPDDAFEGCSSLTGIDLPKNIVSIGRAAFKKCTSLKSIDIPDSVTEIKWMAFEECESLKHVKLPRGLKVIGVAVFSGCTSLKTVDIPNSVESIHGDAFSHCTSLKKIELPRGVTSIYAKAFYKCIKLRKINLPEGLKEIGEDAFRGTTFDRKVIQGPHYIQKVYCGSILMLPSDFRLKPDTLGLAAKAFFLDKRLQHIDLPDSLANIGDECFSGCENLASIVVPDKVEKIGERAFSACYALEEITIPQSVLYIGEKTFLNCPKLNAIYCFENSVAHKYAEENKHPFKFIGSMDIEQGDGTGGDTIEGEPSDVISPQTDLKSFALLCNSTDDEEAMPIVQELREQGYSIQDYDQEDNQAEELTDMQLNSCSMLLAFVTEKMLSDKDSLDLLAQAYTLEKPIATAYVNKTPDDLPLELKATIGQIEGVYYSDLEFKSRLSDSLKSNSCYSDPFLNYKYSVEGDNIVLLKYLGEEQTVYVPRGYPNSDKTVTIIGKETFSKCESIIKVVLPDSIETIEKYAFLSCKNLKEINIPTKLTAISDYCFAGCTSLAKIDLNESIIRIGDGAFASCGSFTEITVPKNVTELNGNEFVGCKSLKKINVDPDNKHFVSQDGVLFSKGFVDIISVPAGIEGEYVIPEGVQYIGPASFKGCFNITEVSIPDGVKQIGKEAFSNCKALRSITIPDSVTGLYSESLMPTFGICHSLKEINIGKGITHIPEGIFLACKSLESIIIPDSVTSIDQWVFQNCDSLKKVYIPSSVTNMANQLFLHCNPSVTIYTTRGSYAAKWAREHSVEIVVAFNNDASYSQQENWTKLHGIAVEYTD